MSEPIINYTVTHYRQMTNMKDFIARYQDIEKFMAFCRECPNYNSVWSCPSLSFEVPDFLSKFTHVYIASVKLDLSKETIEYADTSEKIKSVTYDILWPEKDKLQDKLREAEKFVPGSTSLTAGGCSICKKCSRKDGEKCRFPEKMRYSLDSFGFDLSAITHDVLGYDIQWCKGRLPDYYTLVHALLTPGEIDESIWEKVGL